MNLVAKLNPSRFPGMSGKMSALVGFILSEKFTDPHFEALTVTMDGMLLGQISGDIGFNEFIGTVRDLQSNWNRLTEAAELSELERAAANKLFRERIGINP